MFACYAVYNNEATLRESLTSILPYVEKVVAVDGVWKGFPYNHAASTDATKKIFFELCGDKLIWIGCAGKAWANEIVKRTEYLKHVPDGKWFLVIDGDEVIRGKIAEAFKFVETSRFNCIAIPFRNYMPVWKGLKITHIRGSPCFVYRGKPITKKDWKSLRWKKYSGKGKRFYRKIKGMEYRKTHASIWIGKKVTHIEAIVKNVVLVNMPHKRGWEKWQRNLMYKQKARV